MTLSLVHRDRQRVDLVVFRMRADEFDERNLVSESECDDQKTIAAAISKRARSPFRTTTPGTVVCISFIEAHLAALTSLVHRTIAGFALGFAAANLAKVDCLMILTATIPKLGTFIT
jgi:hypothetical protein